MEKIDPLEIRPFEICSIRPPTENFSLTFRLSRNCYWNRCRFCPVYKLQAKFSRRSLDDIREDIKRAKMIDDLLFQSGIGTSLYSDYDLTRGLELAQEIKQKQWEAGIIAVDEESDKRAQVPDNIDPRMRWFLSWFKDAPVLEDSISHIINWRIGGGKTCFLGDADSLILKPDFITDVMKQVRAAFPSVERFTIYGKTRTAARVRSLSDLKKMRRGGLDRVHYGLESGDDRVLEYMEKGVTARDHIDGCLKTREAGLSCSIYIMPGLGGKELSVEHARNTADVITQTEPDYVRLRTLEIFPGTPLDEARKADTFTEAEEEEVAREIRIMLEQIQCETEILSDSASNLLNLFGKLPDDREAMLKTIDGYLALSGREKLEFSLESRLRSFVGQYGMVTEDIVEKVSPFILDGGIRYSDASETQLRESISLVRSKLMP